MYLIDIDTNTYCSCSFIDFIHVALRWVYSSRYMYTCVYYAYYWGAGTASPGGSGLLRVTWAEPLLIRFSRTRRTAGRKEKRRQSRFNRPTESSNRPRRRLALRRPGCCWKPARLFTRISFVGRGARFSPPVGARGSGGMEARCGL